MTGLEDPCAWQIAVLVAEKLGFEVSVPGADGRLCFVNGRDSMGRAGMLKISKRPGGEYDTEELF